jgi:hypothetical protein
LKNSLPNSQRIQAKAVDHAQPRDSDSSPSLNQPNPPVSPLEGGWSLAAQVFFHEGGSWLE